MQIGGLQKCSLIDYPGKISAVVFAIGCNMRCAYCHNPELVYKEQYPTPIPEEEVLNFLKTRINKLQAVVISGGEPTLQPDLSEFAKKVKNLGYLVKLDTNGTSPGIIKKLIDGKLIDLVAMDIKAPLNAYNEICGVNADIKAVETSINLLKTGIINYYFRTTISKNQSNEYRREIEKLASPGNHIFQEETPARRK